MQRSILLRDNFCRVKNVEAKSKSLVLIDDLHLQFPLRIVARFNGIVKVLSVEVCILASNVLGFVPDQTGLALLGLPMPFYQFGVSVFVY